MAGENNLMYGVHLTYTQEQKDKMSERNKRMGRWVGEDNPWYGKPSPFKGKNVVKNGVRNLLKLTKEFTLIFQKKQELV